MGEAFDYVQYHVDQAARYWADARGKRVLVVGCNRGREVSLFLDASRCRRCLSWMLPLLRGVRGAGLLGRRSRRFMSSSGHSRRSPQVRAGRPRNRRSWTRGLTSIGVRSRMFFASLGGKSR